MIVRSRQECGYRCTQAHARRHAKSARTHRLKIRAKVHTKACVATRSVPLAAHTNAHAQACACSKAPCAPAQAASALRGDSDPGPAPGTGGKAPGIAWPGRPLRGVERGCGGSQSSGGSSDGANSFKCFKFAISEPDQSANLKGSKPRRIAAQTGAAVLYRSKQTVKAFGPPRL